MLLVLCCINPVLLTNKGERSYAYWDHIVTAVFQVPTPTAGSRGWFDGLWLNLPVAEDGRFPCRISKTAISSERRE